MDTVFIAIVLLGMYFLPTIVADMVENRDSAAIGVLNLFLGWTFIGWVICLVWALKTPPAPVRRKK